MARLKPVTDADFDRVVASAELPVLVEFWKPGCRHCRVLTGELERVQESARGRVVIVTMNVEDNYQIPADLEIVSLPALALYRGGTFERFIGGLGTHDAILEALQLPPEEN